MKLLIREYLSLLKESGELDKLLPRLLINMGIIPLTTAQIGVRQNGVDIAAIKTNKDKSKELYLFVIKRGDINRKVWDDGPQGVRATLNEIIDVYLKSRIDSKYKDVPKKIILCTGGELKQEVESNWQGFTNQKNSNLEFDFWGGDALSDLISVHLFNENILSNELRSNLRKALATLTEPEAALEEYTKILNSLLLDNGEKQSKPTLLKNLRTLVVCQSIIHFWSMSEKNLKPSILCSERTVLLFWNYIYSHNLQKDRKVIDCMNDSFMTLYSAYVEFFKKINPRCNVKYGLYGYSGDPSQQCVSFFEQLGLLSTFGILFYEQEFMHNPEKASDAAKLLTNTIKSMINNHPVSTAPCYDQHIIEISQTIYLLNLFDEKDFIKSWIEAIVDDVAFAYFHLGRYFPISSDSFEDLIELNKSNSLKKESLFELSTLLPILVSWCVVLDMKDTYSFVIQTINQIFSHATLQIWHPDSDSESKLYIANAATSTGAMEAPINFSDKFDDTVNMMMKLKERLSKNSEFSCNQHGFGYIVQLASRHFRTPPISASWLHYLKPTTAA